MALRTADWMRVVAVLVAVGLASLDLSIVILAYDTIMGSMSATLDEISWISTAYVLGGIGTMPLNGWLHARLGRRRVFLIAIAVFTAGSAACALSTNVVALTLARTLQGAGGGLLMPTGLAILLATFPAEKRARAQTLYGYGFMLGPLIGLFLAGAVLTVSTWPVLFAINVPLGVLAFVLVALSVDDAPAVAAAPFQPLTLLAMVVGLFALQDVLQRGEAAGWFASGEIVFASAVAAVGLTAFVLLELSTARPMVDLQLLRIRTFWTVNANAFLFAIGAVGVPFLLTAFLQDVLGYDPWTTSVALAPTVIATIGGMALGRPLAVRLSPYATMALGFALMAAGCWWLASLRPESTLADVAAARALLGFGNGIMFVPMGLVTVADVPLERMPAATGLIGIDRQIASAFSIAIAATAFEHALVVERAHVAERVSRNAPAVTSFERAPRPHGSPTGTALLRAADEREAQNDAYAQAFRAGAFACGAAAIFAFAPYPLRARRRTQTANAG